MLTGDPRTRHRCTDVSGVCKIESLSKDVKNGISLLQLCVLSTISFYILLPFRSSIDLTFNKKKIKTKFKNLIFRKYLLSTDRPIASKEIFFSPRTFYLRKKSPSDLILSCTTEKFFELDVILLKVIHDSLNCFTKRNVIDICII